MSSYAELHCGFEEQSFLGIFVEALRRHLIKTMTLLDEDHVSNSSIFIALLECVTIATARGSEDSLHG